MKVFPITGRSNRSSYALSRKKRYLASENLPEPIFGLTRAKADGYITRVGGQACPGAVDNFEPILYLAIRAFQVRIGLVVGWIHDHQGLTAFPIRVHIKDFFSTCACACIYPVHTHRFDIARFAGLGENDKRVFTAAGGVINLLC